MPQPYTIGHYLADRLAELGVRHVFGVPGDFNLMFLDRIVEHPGLAWVGNVNELNAGYAADGYARMNGIAALVTTFGVGELSAVNATAGSYAEHVPVVHICGGPTVDAQRARRSLHHSLGDGDFEHFLRIQREITCAQASLTPANATREIDRVLREVREQRRPGYLLLPSDVAQVPSYPPAAPIPGPQDASSPGALAAFQEAAAKLLADKRPAVLADLLVHRFGAVGELARLLDAGALPHATLLWGKSIVDELDPNFLGIYIGANSEPHVRAGVEEAEALILAGVQFTDFISGFFTQHLDVAKTVDIGPHESTVAGELFAPLEMRDALGALTELLSGRPRPPEPAAPAPPAASAASPGEALTQASMWDLLAGAVTPGNIVIAEAGTSFFGLATHPLPAGVTFIGQPLWASIGYTLPAALGAGLACPDRRVVLLIGDGSAQLTAQELSVIARYGLNAVIVVVDNDGYTVERAIHGAQQPYNDIDHWDYAKLLSAFEPETEPLCLRVGTVGGLRAAIEETEAAKDRLVLIEAVVAKMDMPPLLQKLGETMSEANTRA
ncbi:Pyruvate decarboxylase [Segniliparus rotundus DSM 44985]|uniref:Alpha-keto-acid decarboxylase n=1 Tax=Segniliparus rotundus (strain ATCC BAA-972 / CDC 1076 / CIP 108378 / DSM 44985 / JCM 13578) TaxID=640132 RepID=D6ZAX9_SEGRD|nr:alpha-keto acid decarboxylase family protein [Segniliparus rotundus]ADG96738.1 Pyruvate decarboxylase [Segniliparus rotundus DSM 44985]